MEPELQKIVDKIGLPGVIIGGVLLFALLEQRGRPAWLKDCAPVGGRRAGPWRGKGSFGSRPFGTQVSHK